MSLDSYRLNIIRLTKEKASLEQNIARERKEMSQIESNITSIKRSIKSNTSLSTQQSKQAQINSQQQKLAQCQKKLADSETKICTKLVDINRNSKNLEQAEKQEQKKRQDEELRHAQSITYETERQAQNQRQFIGNRLVIDVARLPEKIKVLFMASNPLDQSQLRLDEEIRAITEKIRASEYRKSVELVSKWAVRPSDLLQALNELKPHIIHFSGHGSSNNELIFQSDDGSTKLVSKGAIVTTMSTVTDNIRLVIFNACFSRDQAEAVTQYVDAAIGMNNKVGDNAARVFAAQFYSAIGFGRSIKQAFEQGRSALLLEGIPEENTPVLFTRDSVDSESIILVRPPSLAMKDYLC